MLAQLSDPSFQIFQGRAGLNQPIDLLAGAIMRRNAAVAKHLAEPGDRVGVDRIVLGQPSGGLSEMPYPLRIDNDDLDPGRAQDLRPASLVAAARLHHRPADPVRSRPQNHLGLAFRRARRRKAQSSGTKAGVDFALGDIEADNAHLLWHTPTPFLARAGSHAHATVRVEEDAGPVPCFPTGFSFGGHELRPSDGRMLEQPPVRPISHIWRTQGGAIGRRKTPVFLRPMAPDRVWRAGIRR